MKQGDSKCSGGKAPSAATVWRILLNGARAKTQTYALTSRGGQVKVQFYYRKTRDEPINRGTGPEEGKEGPSLGRLYKRSAKLI